VTKKLETNDQISNQAAGQPKHRVPLNFWSLYTMLRFRWLGIRFGRGLRAFGPVLLRLQGSPRNIQIGHNVTLLPYVDLRLRDQGRIILHDGVYVETMARLLAANEATLEIDAESQIGIGSVINAGADVHIGHSCAIAGYCSIIASEHSYFDPDTLIKHQGYHHAPINIGEGVWLASGVLVRPGVTIGAGAVVGAMSVVHESLPPNSVSFGNPAKPAKMRPGKLDLD
jgi:acetyltransferase-like isoleucine patch superfamily enzyme